MNKDRRENLVQALRKVQQIGKEVDGDLRLIAAGRCGVGANAFHTLIARKDVA